MAFNALRSTLRRGPADATSADGPIEYAPVAADRRADGGVDAAAFPCPSCGRTLAHGARRCPGCGQRLILDVPLARASTLAGGGAAAGVLVTLLLVNLFAPARQLAPAPDTAAGAGPGATADTAALAIPAGAAAALRGTTAMDGRLAAEADLLAAAIGAKSVDTGNVVKIFRRLNIDTRSGAGMVNALGAWPDAAGQQAALAAFYEELSDRLQDGLSTSVRTGAAYRGAAKAVMTTLGRIPALDADARTLAAQGGLELAPVTIPEALR